MNLINFSDFRVIHDVDIEIHARRFDDDFSQFRVIDVFNAAVWRYTSRLLLGKIQVRKSTTVKRCSIFVKRFPSVIDLRIV